MKNTSDGFSDNSYEDLLEEYAGKLSGSRPPQRSERDGDKRSAETDTHTRITDDGISTHSRAVGQRRAPSAEFQKSFERQAQRQRRPISQQTSVDESKINIDISKKSTNASLDLGLIKSFEDTEPPKSKTQPKSSPSKRLENDFLSDFEYSNDIYSNSSTVSSKSNADFDYTPRRSAPNQSRIRKPNINLQNIPRVNKASVKNRVDRIRHSTNVESTAEGEGMPYASAPQKKKKTDFKTFFRDFTKNLGRFAVVHKNGLIIALCCVVIAVGVSAIALSCINDVLAIGRDSETSVEVELPNDADIKTAIGVLDDAGLIKNRIFCNMFISLMGKTYDKKLLPGVYYFTADMGVEKMIKQFQTSSKRGAQISITIPEGYTIDQIFERLEKNGICTAEALYKTIENTDFTAEYDFLKGIQKTDDRYHLLEGYMFPATYEFEQGADPAAVIREFLNAFKVRWSDEYAARAAELSMSVDDIIKIASIIEKEAANEEEFKIVSSVLHNRLNRSGLYPTLECNSTGDYVTNTIAKRVKNTSQIATYIRGYSTYDSEGLPSGAICNPSQAAIEAALYPETSQYYYFRHDKNGKIYLAKNNSEHSANGAIVNRVNAED